MKLNNIFSNAAHTARFLLPMAVLFLGLAVLTKLVVFILFSAALLFVMLLLVIVKAASIGAFGDKIRLRTNKIK